MLDELRRKPGKLQRKITKKRKKYIWRILYEHILELDKFYPQTGGKGRLVPADEKNLKKLRKRHRKELKKRKYHILASRLQGGHDRCYWILNEQGKICGYCHLAFASHLNTSNNYWVELLPEEVYLFDAYVFKKHRRQGYQKFSVSQRLQIAWEMGYKRAIIIASPDNVPTNQIIKKFGFNRNKVLIYFPLLHRTVALQLRQKPKTKGKTG